MKINKENLTEGYRQDLWDRVVYFLNNDLDNGYVTANGDKLPDIKTMEQLKTANGMSLDVALSTYLDNYCSAKDKDSYLESCLYARNQKGRVYRHNGLKGWYEGADRPWYNLIINVADILCSEKNEALKEAKQKTALKSNGVYSVMKDAWIKEPVAEDIPEVDKEAFEKELKVWEDEAKELLNTSEKNLTEDLVHGYTYEDADKIFELVKSETNEEKAKYLRDTLSECLFELYMDNDTSDEWRHGRWVEITNWIKANPLSKTLKEAKDTQITKKDIIKLINDAAKENSQIKIFEANDFPFEIVKAEEESANDYFKFYLTGGLNGSGKWKDYLKDLFELFKLLEKETGLEPYIIDENTDCADDIFTIHVGLANWDNKALSIEESLYPIFKNKLAESKEKLSRHLHEDLWLDQLINGCSSKWPHGAKLIINGIKNVPVEFYTFHDISELEIDPEEYIVTNYREINNDSAEVVVKKYINDPLTESKETDILKARSIIADQIRGEWDADKGYTKAAADLAELKDIDTKEAQNMMLDIASEEHVHVGELETAYDAFDPHLFDELEDGHNEADEKAEPANALDYDIAEEPVADGLDIEEDYKKGVNNKTLKDVMMSVANSIAPEQILPDTAYDVHHLDYNNTNNEIYNISIMPAKLHRSFHAKARHLTPQEKDNLFKNTPEYYENCIKIGNLILSFIEQQGPKAELAENCLKTIKETLKKSDYLGDEEECAWCHEKFPKSELEFEKDFGPLCHRCIQAIKSREGEDSLEFKESLEDTVSQDLGDIRQPIENNEEEVMSGPFNYKYETAKEKGLAESAESDKVAQIEDYIERLYELRKKSIAEEGEFSIQNLVFKEIRNKGYLDKLRDLKASLIDKDLSLENLNAENIQEDLGEDEVDVAIIGKYGHNNQEYLYDDWFTKQELDNFLANLTEKDWDKWYDQFVDHYQVYPEVLELLVDDKVIDSRDYDMPTNLNWNDISSGD